MIEKLLPEASSEVKSRFFEALREDVRTTASDAFASHVLETLMTQMADEDALAVERVVRFAVNNLESFGLDRYASHVLRRSLSIAASIEVDDKFEVNVKSDFNADKAKILESAVQRFLDIENHEEFLNNDTTNGVLQRLLIATSTRLSEKFEVVSDVFLDCFGADFDFFEYQATCRTLECLIANSEKRPKLKAKVIERLFKGRFSQLSLHKNANFAVQRVLQVLDKEEFESIYTEEFDKELKTILDEGHVGVILALAKASNRLKAKQLHFSSALFKAFECNKNPDKIFAKLLEDINVQKSLLAQELLHFQKPIKFVSSLLKVIEGQGQLFCDPRGSRIADAFVSSPTIGEKSREGLVKALKGQLKVLACSKHGSRSLEAIFKAASPKYKEIIASELCKDIQELKSDRIGMFIVQNFDLQTFKRSVEDWREARKASKKKRELFDDLIKEEPKAKKAKKLKKKAKSYLDDL